MYHTLNKTALGTMLSHHFASGSAQIQRPIVAVPVEAHGVTLVILLCVERRSDDNWVGLIFHASTRSGTPFAVNWVERRSVYFWVGLEDPEPTRRSKEF